MKTKFSDKVLWLLYKGKVKGMFERGKDTEGFYNAIS